MAQMRELLEDQEYADVLLENEIPVRTKVLLHGPSGCGKTSIAHALAAELNIKLYAAPIAQLNQKHMGESEKAVDSIFTFAAANRCVMLLDEFDSICSERNNESANSGVTNRVVNTILTRMESKEPLGMIVACTNFFSAIDQAALRRFDLILEVPSPTRATLKKIAESVLKGRFGLRAEQVLAEATTPAMVVKVARDMVRRKVIEKERLSKAASLSLFDSEKPSNTARNIRQKLEKAATQ
jgi:SpoVK/Ycf46/Vps4 family AAA+-type ATPase